MIIKVINGNLNEYKNANQMVISDNEIKVFSEKDNQKDTEYYDRSDIIIVDGMENLAEFSVFENIDELIIKRSNKIKILNLMDVNKLTIDDDSLKNINQLRIVNMNNLSSDIITKNLLSLTIINSKFVDNQLITRNEFENLTYLKIEECNLKSLSLDSNFPRLETLYLKNNDLEELDIKNLLISILFIDITGNRIKYPVLYIKPRRIVTIKKDIDTLLPENLRLDIKNSNIVVKYTNRHKEHAVPGNIKYY